MSKSIDVDFTEMEHKLKCYIDKGRIALGSQVKEEPLIAVKPDASLIMPLKKVTTYMGSFIAVDCSTRTLKRANNWGVYLMRASCVSVRERAVDWSYLERICTLSIEETVEWVRKKTVHLFMHKVKESKLSMRNILRLINTN